MIEPTNLCLGRRLLARRPAAAALAFLLLALPATAGAQADYLIGPKDVLTVSVWEMPDLTGKYTVEADGTFTFPLVGRVTAGGLTIRQFEQDLKKRLTAGRFLKNPQVTVAVDQYASQRVYVMGEVRQSGPQVLTGEMTLVEVLARAGITPLAGNEAILVRAAPGKTATGPTLPGEVTAGSTQRIDLRRLQEGGSDQNVQVHDGDTIFVPKAETVYVFGQVRTPGAYPMQTRDITVMQALALAGGLTDRGAVNRIEIVRIVDGKERRIHATLSDKVQPGDTVIVPERWI